MANKFLTPTQIIQASLGSLSREVVLPQLVWKNPGTNWPAGGGDTITIKVPARTQARSRPLRGNRTSSGIIQSDELTETAVDVTLDEDIYNSIPITDEELTLDITSFGQQVLQPQVRAVGEGLEDKLAAVMTSATYDTANGGDLPVNTADPYETLVDARTYLNKQNVPFNDRTCVVGADLEALFLKSKHISEVDKSGSDSALRDAVIGRIAGFGNIYVSNALPSNVGFCFHRTAYALALRAPVVPDGVSMGMGQSYQGLSLRWIKDYDYLNVQDRSLVNSFAGANIVADGPLVDADADTTTPKVPSFVRAVKLSV